LTDSRPKVSHWFAIDENRPLFAVAGIWRPWTGARGPKSAPIEGEHLLYSILTCAANDLVRPIRSKAMPAALTNEDEWDQWLGAPVDEALKLQRSLPNETMRVVTTGEKEDGARGVIECWFLQWHSKSKRRATRRHSGSPARRNPS
jgi:putative SOS response-associated peptidase YedK